MEYWTCSKWATACPRFLVLLLFLVFFLSFLRFLFLCCSFHADGAREGRCVAEAVPQGHVPCTSCRGVDYSPLDRSFHSSVASTKDIELKKEVRVRIEGSGDGTISYQFHNRRYLNAKLPILS